MDDAWIYEIKKRKPRLQKDADEAVLLEQSGMFNVISFAGFILQKL